MICPRCSSEKAYVYRTVRTAKETSRSCRCDCGASWWTDERVRPGSLHRVSHIAHGCATGALPVAEVEHGGVNEINDLAGVSRDSSVRQRGEGGISLSFSGFSSPSSSPDSSQPSGSLEGSSKSSARASYSAEFEALWEHTGRSRGNKGAAWKAFQAAVTRPWLKPLCAAWDAYMASSGPAGGFVQHLSTWLNQRGWETDWQPAKARTRDDRNTDVIGDWLEKEAAHG